MDANNIREEEQLIQRFQAGDWKAFKTIYDRYWLKLYTVAYVHIGTKEEAEDLVHNVFENVWKKRSELQIRNLTTYLIASTKYMAIAYVKSKINLRKYQEYLILQQIERDNTIEELINVYDLQKAVEEAMKKLPEKTLEVFKMSRYEHKTISEIAKHLNLSEKAVQYHITRSLKVLKERLQGFNQN